MFFDGSSSKEGLGVGVVLFSPSNHVIYLCYNMELETTKNKVEYEAIYDFPSC